jgi:hypothetical protein
VGVRVAKRGHTVRFRLTRATLLAALLLLPLILGEGAIAPASASAASPLTPFAPANGLSVLVTADGHPTAAATSPSSAVSISLGSPVNVTFAYSVQGGSAPAPAGVSISVARLQLLVLGIVAGAKELDLSNVHASTSGTVSVVGDYSYAKYLIEGVYAMHAELLDPNGSNLFSETFYLKIHAPYDLTVVTVVFALLIVYEVFAVVSMGSARAVASQVRAAEDARTKRPEGGTP